MDFNNTLTKHRVYVCKKILVIKYVFDFNTDTWCTCTQFYSNMQYEILVNLLMNEPITFTFKKKINK